MVGTNVDAVLVIVLLVLAMLVPPSPLASPLPSTEVVSIVVLVLVVMVVTVAVVVCEMSQARKELQASITEGINIFQYKKEVDKLTVLRLMCGQAVFINC